MVDLKRAIANDKMLDGVLKELIGVLEKARVTEDPVKGLKQIEAAARIYLMLLPVPRF